MSATPQAVRDLENLIEAAENVDWSSVEEIPTADVAKWTQRLEYARKVTEAEVQDAD